MKKLLLTSLTCAAAVTAMGTGIAEAKQDKLSQYDHGANITLNGTASNISDDSFTLDYGTNQIQVNFNEWDFDSNSDLRAFLENGEQVAVSGMLDDNWFSDRTLDANNIYVKDTGDYYSVSDTFPAYDNGYDDDMSNETTRMEDGAYVSARGEIQSVDGDEFVLRMSDSTTINVEFEDIERRDIFSNQNALKAGDKVAVYGEIDDGFFDSKEIDANRIVRLR